MLDPGIFRAYDIRGIVDENLGASVVRQIGRAFCAEALALGQHRVVTGRDGRHSGPALHQALNEGLAEGGMEVIDIGMAPTSVLYFATHAAETGAGVMVTGSHNPANYNGLKMMLDGKPLSEAAIQGLRSRIEADDLTRGGGHIVEQGFTDAYQQAVLADAKVQGTPQVVIDCGNGVAGAVAPTLLRSLGCQVDELYCEVDGDFPNHHPDPVEPQNLVDLIDRVRATGAACGLAFDGDGDRLGVVTQSGSIIWPDRLLMRFAQDVIAHHPGAEIIFDVKCSRHLGAAIERLGGRPCMWRTGHSHIKARLRETGAPLGGEFSGHICFADRWFGFDDALYAAARFIELLSANGNDADALFRNCPEGLSTPEIKIETQEDAKFQIIEALARNADFGPGKRTTIDGVRVDYEDGWGLIRASNTSPMLTLRFEADEPSALDRIQGLFQAQLAAIDPKLAFPTP